MSRRRKAVPEDFQMAPMIDMVFLLLVFFMTVSTMAREARPEMELPVSATAQVPEAAPPRHIVSVRSGVDGIDYFWGNRRVDLEALEGLLKEQASHSVTELLLRGEPGLTWSAWEALLQMCRERGISNLVLATFEE